MDQLALIQSAQQGSLEAFNQLVLAYQQRLFNLAVRMLCDDDCAADAVQNAFILAYRHLASFRGGSFASWLLRILKNVCFDELRRQKRQATSPLEPLDTDENEFDTPIWLADPTQNLPEQVENAELSQLIQAGLKRIPPDYRMVLILIDLDGLEYAEAARIIEAPVGTVKSRLARARLRLRHELQKHPELLPPAWAAPLALAPQLAA